MDNNVSKQILDLIYNSICSEGGDGDAIWFSRYNTLDELMELTK